jgi:ribonucleoside-diphosphate reductase alpha chain
LDFSAIRPVGSPRGTDGVLSPGPEPLRRALVAADRILVGAAGRRLRPVEIYDLCMAVAQAALSGGGRRSASICLFSPDDEEMVRAKTGDWQRSHPQRATSNNSAVILRSTADRAQFRHLMNVQREFGEPGFYFTDHVDYGCNPCGEAGLHPVFSPPHPVNLERFLRERGWQGAWSGDERLSGWQMCNLTTVNGRAAEDAGSFLEAVIHAAVIGSLQATYTDIPRLGPVTRGLNDHDALLGVSICGLMDNPQWLLDPRLLETGAETARWVNVAMAALLGVRPAARVTCVKPEGTASLLLGTAAGVHAYPSRRYIRRIRAARNDPVFLAFAAANPEMVEDSASDPVNEAVLVFPVEAPAGAEVSDRGHALPFLERVRFMQQHWVLPGENPDPRSPGLHHTVSHSCPVRASEWSAVADYLWAHREEFSGVTLFGDHAAEHYLQPPVSPARTAADAALWNRLACRPVEYASAGATTLHSPPSAAACSDGVCVTH